MAERVEFHPLFDCDVREAADWYDRRAAGLGDEFVRLTKSTVARVEGAPEQFPRFEGEARYASVPKFPYVVLFELEARVLYFAGVLHTARDPAKWRERLA
ncbi:type II toxin-antitoxin system RelE/ParE family toxin [Botrimarina sp.]|uniref:type II toxin-antitoxin system RelE/ParE family toxin n=1 Tax=Botrimarina sp. TaxID=2795802 RepID=UPI0032EE280E